MKLLSGGDQLRMVKQVFRCMSCVDQRTYASSAKGHKLDYEHICLSASVHVQVPQPIYIMRGINV